MSLAIRLLSDVDGWRCSAAVGKQTGDTVRVRPPVRLPDELRIVEYVRVSACGAASPRAAMNDMGEAQATSFPTIPCFLQCLHRRCHHEYQLVGARKTKSLTFYSVANATYIISIAREYQNYVDIS